MMYEKLLEKRIEWLTRKLASTETKFEKLITKYKALDIYCAVNIKIGDRRIKELIRQNEFTAKLVAKMHQAAVGEIKSPDIHPITDIKNLRKKYLNLLKKVKDG